MTSDRFKMTPRQFRVVGAFLAAFGLSDQLGWWTVPVVVGFGMMIMVGAVSDDQ